MNKPSKHDRVRDSSANTYISSIQPDDELSRTIASLQAFEDGDIARLRAAVRAECRRRKLADSVGAHGEQLAIEYFSSRSGLPALQRAPIGTKNVDALSRSGERFSIKTICEGAKTGTIYPDAGDPNKQLFEQLLIVKLAPDWSLNSIHQLSWTDFLRVRSWDKRMNAWYVAFSNRALQAARVVMKRSESL